MGRIVRPKDKLVASGGRVAQTFPFVVAVDNRLAASEEAMGKVVDGYVGRTRGRDTTTAFANAEPYF
jgi:hypothetical protein